MGGPRCHKGHHHGAVLGECVRCSTPAKITGKKQYCRTFCSCSTMPGSNVWTRSRARMRLFPELLAQCSGEAAVYGRCVAATTTGKQELSKNTCLKEFQALKSCFQSAAKKGVK